MSRRPRGQLQDRIKQTFELLDQAIVSSLYRDIGEELKSGLRDVQLASQYGQLSSQDVTSFISSVNVVLGVLPQIHRQRFMFDSRMIGAIRAKWNEKQQRLFSTIYPLYDTEWGHGRIPMPTRNNKDNFLGFITFPGTDDLTNVDLLDNAFICHELGHNMLYYDGTAFTQHFSSQLEQITGRLMLVGVADRGSARLKAQRDVADIRRVWTPTDNHENWANEMMMDLIALWTCGPAYLASFEYEVDEESKNPYLVSQTHPPYALRIEAMIAASQTLGWSMHVHGLNEHLKRWRDSSWKSYLTNKYFALADSKIIRACVTYTLAACEEIGLPRCDEHYITRMNEVIKRGDIPDFGTDLIIAAWLMRQQTNEQSFEQWEKQTVTSLYDRIANQGAAQNAETL